MTKRSPQERGTNINKYVYLFSEGNGHMRELLGGKGANLAEMTNLGMPVPQGFTITTEACTQYYKDDRQINSEIEAEIMQYVEKLEEMTGKKFGDVYNPLLVSVRSGARASMPGMMDTILNHLNNKVVVAYKTNNPRFAYDYVVPLHPDVLRRRHGSRQEILRAAHRRDEGSQRRHARHRADRRRPQGACREVQGRI